MLIKTSELTGAALDWAVAKITNPDWWADGYMDGDPRAALDMDDGTTYSPSTDWAQGGPIVEREGLNLEHLGRDAFAIHPRWCAWTSNLTWPNGEVQVYGPSPLIAAMRCYVASKLGDEVDVPDALMEAA